jgi:O-antigen/teichoic acid export membrane protein
VEVPAVDGDIEVRMASGTLALSASQVIAYLLGVVFSVITARLLGPESYGLIGVSLTYPTLVASLLDLGLGSIIARYASIPGEGRRVYVWTGAVVKLGLSAAGSLVVYVCADLFANVLARPYLAGCIRSLSLYVLSVALLGCASSALTGLGMYRAAGFITVAQYLLRGPLAIALILAGFGVYGAVVSYSVAYALLGLAYFMLFVKLFRKPTFSGGSLKEMMSLALPIYLASIVGLVVGPTVSTVLARYASNYDISNYNVGVAALTPVNAVASSISTAALTSLPILINNGAELKRKTAQVSIYSSYILTAVVLGYLSVLRPLVNLLYGPEYMDAPTYGLAYALGTALGAALTGGVLGSFFVVVGSTKWNGIIGVIGSVSAIISALLLVPACGALGAALAYAAGGAASSVATYVIARKVFSLNIALRDSLKAAAPALSGCAAAFIASSAVRAGPLIELLLAGAVYVVAYLATLPLSASRGTIENIVELAGKLAYVGKVLRAFGEAYLKLVASLSKP